MIHREAIEALIKEAIDFTLNANGLYAGRAVDDMADAATAAVMTRLGEEPGLEAIEVDVLCGPLLIVVIEPQAETQATPSEAVRSTEAVPARPEDGLPLPEFSTDPPAAIYRLTPEEYDWSHPAPPTVPHPDRRTSFTPLNPDGRP